METPEYQHLKGKSAQEIRDILDKALDKMLNTVEPPPKSADIEIPCIIEQIVLRGKLNLTEQEEK